MQRRRTNSAGSINEDEEDDDDDDEATAEDTVDDVSMVSERADAAEAGAEAIVTGIEKERCSDEANANPSGLSAAGALLPAPPTTFDDCPSEVNASEEEEAPAVAVAVLVSGRRSCHASAGVRSISADRTPVRVRRVKVGGSAENPAKVAADEGDADADDDDDNENENAVPPFAALWRGVDDRV